MIRFAAPFLAAAGLAACAQPPAAPVSLSDPADLRIANAVEAASRANAAVAEVEVATAAPVRPGPGAAVPETVTLPPEAVQPVTVDWNGPVETLLEAVAKRGGYRFAVIGRAPAAPVMVSIRAREEPLYGVLRRVGMTVHGHADVAFDVGRGVVELRYGG